jgi:hypothetical protein
MHMSTQRQMSKSYDASDSSPVRPWERPINQLTALEHAHVDEVDGRQVHWIPGVVLIVIEDEPQLAEGLRVLGQMLQDGTTSLGIALVERDVPLRVDHAALGRRRLRALTVRDVRAYLRRSNSGQEVNANARANDLADKYLEDLGRQTRDRVLGRGRGTSPKRDD